MPIDKILSVKNARAWVSMVSYFKNYMKIKVLKKITILGAVPDKYPAHFHQNWTILDVLFRK